MKFIYFFLFTISLFLKGVNAESIEQKNYFGVDVGYAFVDLGADKTAQTLANLSGSTVTYVEEQASGYLRIYYGHQLNKNFDIQGGYFILLLLLQPTQLELILLLRV